MNNFRAKKKKSPSVFACVVLMFSLFISFLNPHTKVELWHFHTELVWMFLYPLLQLVSSMTEGAFLTGSCLPWHAAGL